jgi:hypothetical protein
MLATLIALHLVAAQTAQPAPARGDDNPYEQNPPAEQGKPNPPLPSKPGARPATPEATPPAPAAAQTAPTPARAANKQLSLLSAETLGGNGAALAWAGWSLLGIAYAGGLTAHDDLGGELDLDWAKTELRIGAFWRHALGTAGPFDMAGRLGLAWYANFGGGWIYDDNHHDRGIELQPALVFSAPGGGGVFSLAAELPFTITVKYDAGLLFVPKLAASYETALYEELTVGVRAALGYRAGSGSAPLSDGRGDLQFLVLAGYRAF